MEFTSSLVNYNTTINIYSGIVEYYSKDYSSSGWLESVKHPYDGGNMLNLDIDYGFTYMTISFDAISWRFVNADLEVVYEYKRNRE